MRPGRDADHPHKVRRLRTSRSYSSLPCRLHGRSGTFYFNIPKWSHEAMTPLRSWKYAQLKKKIFAFYGHWRFMPCSQNASTRLYHVPDESGPHPPNLFSLTYILTSFHLILRLQWSHSFRLSNPNVLAYSANVFIQVNTLKHIMRCWKLDDKYSKIL
jgi:hypothetical protein